MEIFGFYSSTEGCCGVTQITDFIGEHSHWMIPDIVGEGGTEEEASRAFLNSITYPSLQEEEWGPVVQIWFVKRTDYDGNYNANYEREVLRQMVAQIPGVVDLGEHVNPNSGNKIQGYQWEVTR